MPLKSKAQMRMMFAKDPMMAEEWASKTKNIKSLPEKVTKKAKKGAKRGKKGRK